jgi:hypothetical protein
MQDKLVKTANYMRIITVRIQLKKSKSLVVNLKGLGAKTN